VLSTLSVGALKSHGVRFDKSARSHLDPVLAGMTAAKMTKIFVPLRPEFSRTGTNIDRTSGLPAFRTACWD
jgi:hypothetical protein